MSRKEVDKLSERAKAEQNLWNAMVPENRITFTSPMFWLLLVGCVGLHFYNGHNAKEEERRAQEEDELLRQAEEASRRKREARKQALESTDLLDPTLLVQSPEYNREAHALLAFKRKQLSQWENKLHVANQSANAAQAQLANQRVAELQDAVAALERSCQFAAAAGVQPR